MSETEISTEKRKKGGQKRMWKWKRNKNERATPSSSVNESIKENIKCISNTHHDTSQRVGPLGPKCKLSVSRLSKFPPIHGNAACRNNPKGLKSAKSIHEYSSHVFSITVNDYERSIEFHQSIAALCSLDRDKSLEKELQSIYQMSISLLRPTDGLLS